MSVAVQSGVRIVLLEPVCSREQLRARRHAVPAAVLVGVGLKTI